MVITKTEFLNVLDECIARDVKLIAVAIKGVGKEEELIINPRANFEDKRAYYAEKYDDEMRMIAAPHIQITYVAGWTHIAYYEEQV